MHLIEPSHRCYSSSLQIQFNLLLLCRISESILFVYFDKIYVENLNSRKTSVNICECPYYLTSEKELWQTKKNNLYI